MQYEVENIKCGGCANSISHKLEAIPGVEKVSVDVENGMVEIEAPESEELNQQVIESLNSMGYPLAGSVSGLKSVKAKANSFVSCAVGRMSD